MKVQWGVSEEESGVVVRRSRECGSGQLGRSEERERREGREGEGEKGVDSLLMTIAVFGH